ncbi:MAG: hypothetical protein M1602_03245 [Firmicutes bacterium]|nr:hypothetical protein [Bacillota bacterium]
MSDERLRGDLVQNGGFEQGLTGWTTTNVGLEDRSYAHEGLLIAAMGKPDGNLALASMYQDVPVRPGRFYKLYFFVAGVAIDPADLTVDVRWLSDTGGDLGTGLPSPSPLFVPNATIGAAGAGEWKWVAVYANESPYNAVQARISFNKAIGLVVINYLLIDDVVFADQS